MGFVILWQKLLLFLFFWNWIYSARSITHNDLKHIDLISEKHKKTCKYLSYIEHLLILTSKVAGCASISAFTSLVAVPVCKFWSSIKNLCSQIIKKKVIYREKEEKGS